MKELDNLEIEIYASNASLIGMLASIGLEVDTKVTKVVVIEEIRGCIERIADAVSADFAHTMITYYSNLKSETLDLAIISLRNLADNTDISHIVSFLTDTEEIYYMLDRHEELEDLELKNEK